MMHGWVKPSTAAKLGLRRCSTTCHASQQLARPPQRPTDDAHENQPNSIAGVTSGPTPLHQQVLHQPLQQHTAASYEQHLQRLQQHHQQQQQQPGLLTRPSLVPQQQQQQQQPGQREVSSRRVLLDDQDTKMAAFDQMTVQATCARPSAKGSPPIAVSFNKGLGKMKSVMARNLKAARINRPTPLQGHMLPAILSGHDVVAAGPPGAGTSTAALLAVLCKVLSTPRTVPRNKAMPLAVVLCPSRELAMQLAAEGSKLVTGTQITVRCVTGGAELAQQVIELRHGADLLVCTPGRLLDLLVKKAVSLARLKHLVLEDVDELMGPVLSPVTRQILHHHTMPSYQLRQTIALGSSAFPQQQLLAAAADVLRPSPVVIRASWPLPDQQQQGEEDSAQLRSSLASPSAALAAAAAAAASAVPPSVTQRFLGVAAQVKMRFLLRVLSAGAAGGGGGLVLIFTNTRTAAEEVWQHLEAAGVSAGVLHYARSQTQRDEALQCFKYGVTQVLVACGIAYRGLDLPDVAQVINYDIPMSLAEYARRLGTAGRAGRQGMGTTLVTPGDGAAVAPLVAVLRACGQLVPDWLLSVAEGAGKTDAAAGEGVDTSSKDVSKQPAVGAGDTELLEAAAGGQQQSGPSRRTAEREEELSNGNSSSSFRVRSRGGHRVVFGSYVD